MLSTFDILVKKLWKHRWKIITNEHIQTILTATSWEEVSNAKVYKTTHNLKNKWYLISLKKNCFLVTQPSRQPDEDEIILTHYWELLRKHCQEYIQGSWYIGWLKALELHLQNYEVPDTIEIVNTYKNALEVILFDKIVSYKRYNYRQQNILPKIKKHLSKIKIGKYSFPLAPLELAMLESLHNPSTVQLTLINEYIKKILRKNKKSLDFELFEKMLMLNKHHVGVNRIYQLSKDIDPILANRFLEILKKFSFVMQ